jgi:DNA polymerase-3 subunit delta
MASALVGNEAMRRGLLLAPDAAEHLVNRVGNDIQRLLSELEKCSLRAGDGPVTAHIIDEMVKRTPQDTIFDLTDALGERQGARALATLRELVGSGEAPERVLATFVTHLRKLLQARAFLDAGVSLDSSTHSRLPRELMAQLPQDGRENLALTLQNPSQAWRGRKFAAQARNFSLPQLQNALAAALTTDLAMKGIEGDGGSSEMLLELFVAGLC